MVPALSTSNGEDHLHPRLEGLNAEAEAVLTLFLSQLGLLKIAYSLLIVFYVLTFPDLSEKHKPHC